MPTPYASSALTNSAKRTLLAGVFGVAAAAGFGVTGADLGVTGADLGVAAAAGFGGGAGVAGAFFVFGATLAGDTSFAFRFAESGAGVSGASRR